MISRVANAAQQLSAEATDSCNFVPDSFLAADFTLACDHHDDCYERRSSMSRLNCDQVFLTELINTWAIAPGFQPAQRLTCYAIAGIYFIGVRLFGASSTRAAAVLHSQTHVSLSRQSCGISPRPQPAAGW
jgi:hypothetical protein